MKQHDHPDRYDYWRRVLNGERVPILEDDPQQGFYRLRKYKNGPWLPVAIWIEQPKDEDGNPDGDERVITKLESTIVDPDTVWLSCARHTVTYEDYTARIKTGEWPNEAPSPIGHNQGDEQSLADLIKDETERAAAWLEGRKILTQADADKAGNWVDQIAALGKKAENERKFKKQPHWDAGLRVDAEYKPLTAAASQAVTNLKRALSPYLQAREAEKRKEADRAAKKAREAAEASNEPVEAAPPPATKVKAGGAAGRSVSLRSFVSADITDYRAALKHFANHDDVKTVIQKLANAAAKAGVEVPGTKIKKERRAA